MANVKISQLPSATTPLGGSEEIPLVQSSTTKKVTVGGLFTSPTLTTPNLGTPSAVNLTNATNVPVNQATGTLPVANGGTGATTLTGYVKGNGTSAMTASATVPGSDVSGNISGNAANVTGTVAIANGGTGQTTASGAINALLPTQTGNNGKYLTTNGTTASWGTISSTGTVTSVDVSGGTTGLTSSGGPVTTSGTITLAGTLNVTNGGTGATTLTGYVKGNGTSAMTASSTVPGSDVSGNISGNAANVTGTVAVGNGGTGATTLTGYVKGNGTSAMTASSTIPGSDVSGNISGNAANVTGTVAVANGGTGQTTYTDGQLLIGNTATGGLTKATLTAGTNVSIVNGNGTITIAATGGSGGGDVSGPASATNNAVVLFDGTTGKLIKDSAQTIASANTASTVVARDSSGNFSAGTITAALSGNASTATALQTARTINGTSFDGTANITITANTPNALTAGSYLTSGGTFDGSAARTFAVDATDANTASKVVARDASGNFSAGTITANLSGNASTATTATNQSGGTVSATSISDSGNLTFTGTGNRITGDFSNATVANRVMFQTSTTNGATGVIAIPNGTGGGSAWRLYNSSDTANASVGDIAIGAGAFEVRSFNVGTGTYLPMTFSTSGSEKFRIAADATGTYTFGGTAPRITGDFSNATVANRVLFQTSTTNGGTRVGQLPNGTASSSGWEAYSGPSTDLANASFGSLVASGTSDIRIAADRTGTGTYLPMTFYTGGSERVRIDTSGNVGIGTSAPGYRLHARTDGASSTNWVTSQNATASGAFGAGFIGLADAAGSKYFMLYENGDGAAVLTNAFAGPLLLGTNNTERVRIDSSGNVLVTGSGGLGYGTGSGGAVTQATSRTTGVTLDKTNGAITLVSAAGTTTWQTFTVTNNTVAATDTIVVNQKSGTDLYEIHVTNVAAGSFKLSYRTTGGTTTEQPVFNFAVIKAVTA